MGDILARMEKSLHERLSEGIDDNARKFVTGQLDSAMLAMGDVVAYDMTTDWLETDEAHETKAVCKKYDNGDVQYLLITKMTADGKRTSVKERVAEEQYGNLRAQTKRCVEKRRHEFEYAQGDIIFEMKYDVFMDSNLCVLEVDASTDEQRADFVPFGGVEEVTGDLGYYGYRVADKL